MTGSKEAASVGRNRGYLPSNVLEATLAHGLYITRDRAV